MKYNGALIWNSIADLIDHSCTFNTVKFHLKQCIRATKCITIFRGCFLSVCIVSDLHFYIFNKIENRVCFYICYIGLSVFIFPAC